MQWNGRSLICHNSSITIETDASTKGWGAVCNGVRTGGPWSPQERTMHINCLELLAAHLAIKCYAKNKTNLTIILKMDSMSALTYINKRGGTISPRLNQLAKDLWLWCMGRYILLKAQHLPGVYNTTADNESRVMKDRSDWKLLPAVFHRINRRLGPLEVDLFASRLTHHLPNYASWRPDPTAVATDAFTMNWAQMRGYANPPLEPCREGTGPGAPTTGRACTSGASVEGPGLVPSTPGDAGGHTIPDPTEGESHPAHTPRELPLGNSTASRVGYLRQRYQDCHISEEASKLLLASWRQKSSKSYDSLFGKWVRWCGERDSDPVSGPIGEVVNFLAHLFDQGHQYRSINAYRSAISSVHEKADGYEVGQHPLVSRLLKGVFHERPQQPRYSETWDVSRVTAYIDSLGENDSLSLPLLTHKTVMLLALTRLSRSADLSQLNITFRRYLPEGVTFQPTKLSKQSRQCKPLEEIFFPAFPHNKLLCPAETLKAYEERTHTLREGSTTLFLTTIKPHTPVASSTIARWLKSLLGKAGIDTAIFKAHSVRGASTTTAANAGVTTSDILKATNCMEQPVGVPKILLQTLEGDTVWDSRT